MSETATGKTRKRTGEPAAKASAAPEPEGSPPVCTVAFCPICLAVTAAQAVAPDAMDHLLAAARELFLAARAVIDARAEDLSRDGARTRLERIEIA